MTFSVITSCVSCEPPSKAKFGPVVTYEDDPVSHLKTEFGFDVLEVARGNFAPQAYHDFIGFYVAKDLVARAFEDTYGLELGDLFGNFDLAISSYRSAVSRTIPRDGVWAVAVLL